MLMRGRHAIIAGLAFCAAAVALPRYVGETSPTVAGPSEKYRLDNMAQLKVRRVKAMACLDTQAEELASQNSVGLSAAARAYDKCSEAFRDLAVSALSTTPAPRYQETLTLFESWRPYYVDYVFRQVHKEQTGEPRPHHPPKELEL